MCIHICRFWKKYERIADMCTKLPNNALDERLRWVRVKLFNYLTEIEFKLVFENLTEIFFLISTFNDLTGILLVRF